jgi:hypothetical protein
MAADLSMNFNKGLGVYVFSAIFQDGGFKA